MKLSVPEAILLITLGAGPENVNVLVLMVVVMIEPSDPSLALSPPVVLPPLFTKKKVIGFANAGVAIVARSPTMARRPIIVLFCIISNRRVVAGAGLYSPWSRDKRT